MIKKLTVRLGEEAMKKLSLQVKENGFSNYSQYFRYLILSPSSYEKPPTLKESVAIINQMCALDERLQELEIKINEIKCQVKVNEKALLVLLAFFDIEKIPAKGLANARQFLARKTLEIKSKG